MKYPPSPICEGREACLHLFAFSNIIQASTEHHIFASLLAGAKRVYYERQHGLLWVEM